MQSVDIYGTTARASVTVQLNCQDCGTTLKDAEIESETEIEHDCEGKEKIEDGDEQFEVENEGDPEGSSRTQTKDRHGKQIKSHRYMRTFYGFTLESDIKCRKCDEVFQVKLEGEEQASGFNECC
jgi:hypothetical protein